MLTVHQPKNSELPYTVDWSAWLEPGEVIASVVWTVATGLTNRGDSFDDTTATINLRTDGTTGEKLKVTCTVTSDAAQTKKDSRVFFVKIQDL